jgi:hypothetical protein
MDDFNANKNKFIEKTALVFNQEIATQLSRNIKETTVTPDKKPIDPLNSQLGLFRILRTSPLVEVPFICHT